MHGLGKNLAKSSQSKSLELTLPYNSFHLQMCYFSSVFQALSPPTREHKHHCHLMKPLTSHLTSATTFVWPVKTYTHTWTLNKGPIVLVLCRTHADIKDRLQAVFPCGRRGWHLDGPLIGAFDALALAGVAGVGTPPTARLLQTVSARAVAWTVLSCKNKHQIVT